MTIKTTRAEGFSIIEVLVAVVIFTVALVALARFMGGLMVAGSEAKARAFASSLAQEKLEDLRQFTYLPTYADMSTKPNPPDPATFGYADITDDGGGSK
jgi:prepilin-type N-terminal cleavage/methylation domain-containing protein